MKAYRNSVSIITFVAMLLSFMAGALMMVYHVFSHSDAPYPFILDALYECAPELVILGIVTLLIYLFVFITFRVLFSAAIHMDAQKVHEKPHDGKKDKQKDKTNAVRSKVDSDTEPEQDTEYVEPAPVEEMKQEGKDVPASDNSADADEEDSANEQPVQPEPEEPKKVENALSSEEEEMLAVLQNALEKGNVAKGCYSIGEFQPGKVSLFKGAGGAWRVSKPQDIGPQLARGYKDLKKATLEFTRLVSMIRVV